MKVCYIWVENFRNFKRKGFNFSSNVKFHFDPEQNLLRKTLLSKLPKNFFDSENRIEEVTGLIGKNGSGKSNSVDLLLKAIKGSGKYLKTNFLIITEENGNFICYKSFRDQLLNIQSDFELYQQEYQGSLEGLKVIYFSNVFDERENLFDDSISDISVNKSSHPAVRFKGTKNEKSNFVKQHEFIKSRYFNRLEVDKPYSVLITSRVWMLHRYSHGILKSLFGEFSDMFVEYRRSMRSRYRDTKHENKLLFTLKYSVVLESLEIILRYSLSNELKQRFLDRFFSQPFAHISTSEVLDNQMNVIENFDFVRPDEEIENFIATLKNKISFFYYAENSRFFEFIYYTEGDRNKRYEYFELPYEVFTEIFNDNFSDNFFTPDSYNQVDWVGISSGYKAYFNLYASIMHELRKTKARNILLCIDEGDLYLHPKWQLEFLDKLLAILPKMFNGKLQLILTSHSPFLLSDLPKQCITIIDSESLENAIDGYQLELDTFAGNIYDLYSNPFFLGNKHVSDFAAKKLSRILELTKQEQISDTDREEISKVKNLIGDEMIAYQFNKRIHD